MTHSTRHDALAKVIAELRAASWQSLVATAAQIKAARKTTIIFLKVVIMSRFGRRVAAHRKGSAAVAADVNAGYGTRTDRRVSQLALLF